MNKKLLFSLLAAFALIVSVTATGCKHDADSDGGKPGKLATNAGYYDALQKLNDIINYCNTNVNATNTQIKALAQALQTTIETSGSSAWYGNSINYISQINGYIDMLQSGGGSGQGGGGLTGGTLSSSGLVAKWHSTQSVADAGTSVVFEIESNGNMTVAGLASGTTISVSVSGSTITATTSTTAGGGATLTQSATYTVSGTTLQFSNPQPVNGMPFTSLISGQDLSTTMGGTGKYHKKASSGGSGIVDGGGSGLTITGVTGGYLGVWNVYAVTTNPSSFYAISSSLASAPGQGVFTEGNSTVQWATTPPSGTYTIIMTSSSTYKKRTNVTLPNSTISFGSFDNLPLN